MHESFGDWGQGVLHLDAKRCKYTSSTSNSENSEVILWILAMIIHNFEYSVRSPKE